MTAGPYWAESFVFESVSKFWIKRARNDSEGVDLAQQSQLLVHRLSVR